MRKVILHMVVSLDGFIEGADKELDWFVDDDEMLKYFHDLLNSVDAMLYGRVSYQLMTDYWPAANSEFADKMNKMPKIVFSRTLEKVEWNNSRLVKENIGEEISKIKQQPGKDLVLFAGADMASTFRQLGLIDEYRLLVTPVVLGSGKPLFKDVKDKFSLKLLKTKTFGSGNVLLCYQAA
jgi:Dihydrofolate reductase